MSDRLHAKPYKGVCIADFSLVCSLGWDRAAWQALQEDHCGLQEDPLQGWVGSIDLLCDRSHRNCDELAAALAARCWREAESGDLPLLSLSCSKGNTAALLQGDLGVSQWPGACHRAAARRLGLDCFQESGPVAACSTGLYAILAAADAIEAGRCSQALAGAVDRSLQELLLAGFANLGVRCQGRPSALRGEGTGFAPAEGGAAFCLAPTSERPAWRLDAGMRLGDASHETRCDDPAVLVAGLAALWQLAPDPDVIVTHGTGTRQGDHYELTALDRGPWSAAPRCAWKPQIGHCLGASGAVELALALHGPWRRIWKISLGFGGHLAGIALHRLPA